MSWQPILEGAFKDRALESIEAIRAAIPGLDGSEEAAFRSGGVANQAILHAYLAETGYGPGHAAIALECLYRATAAAASGPISTYSACMRCRRTSGQRTGLKVP